MDELFSLAAAVIVLIAGAMSNAAKRKKHQATRMQHNAAAAARIQAAQQRLNDEKQRQSADATAELSAVSAEKAAPMQVIQPTVHAHVEPDCAEHDAPTTGSLDFVSTEGKDPCHKDELTLERQPAEPPVPAAAPGLTFDWSGESLVKAFVMQEVLQRPITRNRR